ncbi:telomeric DNA binding protein [Coprinopsis marcescibilis]|uniref:Telomeric DNA binding protein n=1 Tax=Coprinopsis marcescibilis TaxID=230819 RepID=A0A5C3L0A9_COPMA|nr:telomeric DNA binding protein [Coprinopsis marcescibilis]
MTSSHSDDLQDLLNKLQAPVSDIETLFAYLTLPLENLGLLPPLFRKYIGQPLPPGSFKLSRHLSQFQRAILDHIQPTWGSTLQQHKAGILLDQYFCPDLFSNAFPVAAEVAIVAFSTLLSSRLTAYAIRILERLVTEYPIDRVFAAVTSRPGDTQVRELAWNDYVRNLVKVPSKVANAVGADGTVPEGLENGVYFNRLAERVEALISTLSKQKKGRIDSINTLSLLLDKFVKVGLFPSSPPPSRTQPSFFQAILPIIRTKVYDPSQKEYFSYWNDLFDKLPSSLSLQSILLSLFASLEGLPSPLDDSFVQRGKVRGEAILLTCILGTPAPSSTELWDTATSQIISRNWNPSYARTFVCWISGASMGGVLHVKALESFLESVLNHWSSTDHIKFSLLSQHQYVTSLLLITASYFLPDSPPLQKIAFSTSFIEGITKYLSHQDSSVRHCGMLAAEEIARMTNKKLDFGGWEGEDAGKPWAKTLRQLIRGRDVDAEVEQPDKDATTDGIPVEEISTPGAKDAVLAAQPTKAQFKPSVEGYDSDDSLTGYASSSSSRSASPTPEQLAEIEKDPSLNVGVKKVARPVYLKQLGDLLRGGGNKTSPDDPHEADKLEMGLDCAEELIRRKANYGTELAENAVNLEYALLSLNNNFELPGFSDKRQAALNALVACAPRQTAPALIEEFFKNQYSADQRYVVLNALAMGARELASLPVAESKAPLSRLNFPSKTLPPALHQRYIAAGQANKELVPLLMDDITRNALEHQKESAPVDKNPTLLREKALKVKKTSKISEVVPQNSIQNNNPGSKKTTFTEVAAEYFIAPLINRFWLFLREEQTREERTSHLGGRQRYRGAGTGLILNPLILAHFLRTLAILVHASQNSAEWPAIIAPDALELAISIGSHPMGQSDAEDDEDGTRNEKEASVLSSALELSLIVLGGSINVDGGRTLGLDHTTLLLGVQEWALKIFETLEQGLKVSGGGGAQEVKVRSTSAGVLLKIDEITGKWRRSMLDWR